MDNNDLAEIETALRRLTPRAPSAACVERIADGLSAPSSVSRNLIRWVLPLCAAAACAALLLVTGVATKLERDTPPAGKLAGNASAPAVGIASEPASGPALGAPLGGTGDVVANSAVPDGAVPPWAGAPVRSELRSVEPLEIRRTDDGGYYQSYRVRYRNTVRDSSQDGLAAPILRAVPAEEVHFVRLDFM
jgi:hypothetical protein